MTTSTISGLADAPQFCRADMVICAIVAKVVGKVTYFQVLDARC
jgi:hypothetical protein